ncbi:hypothetical protein LCGC14_3158830 [marine sediment metagenome]|uniref:Uncharacterized protein n=1 Tax=marine sediment metagenome TaxID=412755 RepID=A0A0F8YGC9_9ZZZZ
MTIPVRNPSYISSADEGAGVNVLSNASEVLVAANPDRQYLYVKNLDSTILVSLGLGETAVTSKGIVLAGGETWEMPSHAIWTGAVHIVAASATPSAAYVEY